MKKKKTIFKSVLNRRNVEEYFYNISIENCLSNFYKDALTTNYKGKICTIRIYWNLKLLPDQDFYKWNRKGKPQTERRYFNRQNISILNIFLKSNKSVRKRQIAQQNWATYMNRQVTGKENKVVNNDTKIGLISLGLREADCNDRFHFTLIRQGKSCKSENRFIGSGEKKPLYLLMAECARPSTLRGSLRISSRFEDGQTNSK